MFEQLHQSSLPDVSGILWTAAILWGIWPVVCGAFGATRGQAFKGIVHGFLWGPIGLIIVLLSSQKYECPTCGQKTLRQPYDDTCSTLPLVPGMPGTARKAPTFYQQMIKSTASDPAAAVVEPAQSPVAPPRVARPASPVIPGAASRTPPTPATIPDRRKPVLVPPAAPDPGCDPEEAAKLHEWLNSH